MSIPWRYQDMGRRRIALIIVLLVLVAAGSGYYWHRQEQQAADGNSLVLYGNIDLREVNLAFNGSQRIVSMAAQEGDQVQKGQILAALDTRYLKADVDQAQARVNAQQQVLAALQAGTRAQEIRVMEAKVEAASVALENARRSYRRLKNLATRDMASRQQLDDAQAAMRTASAQLKAEQESLKLGREGPRKQDIAAAAATLDAYRAELTLANARLADAVLRAPANGVIRNRILEPGDMASPQQPVYTLALTRPLWVRTYVPESDLGRIHPGMAATVTTDSAPGTQYRGQIGYISPTAEFTPKTVETPEVRTSLVYQVRVNIERPDDRLRLGMPATVHIDLGGADAASSRPDGAR